MGTYPGAVVTPPETKIVTTRPYVLLAARGQGNASKVNIPFKYLTFREPKEDGKKPPSMLSLTPDEERLSRVVLQRFQHAPVMEVLVKARVQPALVMRTVRFYEAEGTQVSKQVRTDLGGNTQPGYVFCADERVHVRREDQAAQISFRTPMASSTRTAPERVWSFDFFTYDDVSFNSLTSCQRIEVHSMRPEFVQEEIGTPVYRNLMIPYGRSQMWSSS